MYFTKAIDTTPANELEKQGQKEVLSQPYAMTAFHAVNNSITPLTAQQAHAVFVELHGRSFYRPWFNRILCALVACGLLDIVDKA